MIAQKQFLHTFPLLQAMHPIAFVRLPIVPCIFPLAVWSGLAVPFTLVYISTTPLKLAYPVLYAHV